MVDAGLLNAFRLWHHNLRNNGPCALCSQEPEFLDHLLIGCVYSREVWFRVLRAYNWHQFTPSTDAKLITWWLATRKMIAKARRMAFDSVVILVAWNIWLQRNARVFQRQSTQTPAINHHHRISKGMLHGRTDKTKLPCTFR